MKFAPWWCPRLLSTVGVGRERPPFREKPTPRGEFYPCAPADQSQFERNASEKVEHIERGCERSRRWLDNCAVGHQGGSRARRARSSRSWCRARRAKARANTAAALDPTGCSGITPGSWRFALRQGHPLVACERGRRRETI